MTPWQPIGSGFASTGFADDDVVTDNALTDGAKAWTDAMTALALFAIDPCALGGISVRACAGPVRDRWLALARNAFPTASPMRRMPSHADDDRVLGGLDLAATLRFGRPIEQKGLLAETDGGVLVLAMAERVEPAVAARLTAAMDLGAVCVPRDGLTLRSPARFGLIALDEGIAPDERTSPALLDRLAFHIDLSCVSAREVGAPWWRETSLMLARETLACVTVPDGAVEALCGGAMALGIDSIRAPLLALRAARAVAALDGRFVVAEADLIQASRLVLGSRATRLPPADSAEAEQEPEPAEASDDRSPDQEALGDRPLEDVVLDAVRAGLPQDLLAHLAVASGAPVRSRQSGRAGQVQASACHGRPIGVRRGRPTGGARLHVLETLKAAAPWQALRRGESPDRARHIEVRADDFRIVRFQKRTETTTVFAVDASGSAALHRLGEAKGAVELLLADCYVRRDQVALIAFRFREATLLLPPTRSLVRAKRCLAGLPGGGATPLAAGMDAATLLAQAERRRGRTPVIVLLTDGRANMARDGTGGRPVAEAEALSSARSARAAGFTTLLVDTSQRPNPFARYLADEMRARYVPLPHADASTLSRAVRSATAA